ncbi:MAG TPA: hypothetical protein VKV40_08015 [Ktedonobacteraceae bacterium]|nr:hypothetical protein [Ktedonobacteraceae bacterium]
MLNNVLKRWFLILPPLLLFVAMPLLFPGFHNSARASQNIVTGSHHYFYDFPNGSMNVYDMDNNFALVQHVSIPTTNVRGVVFDPHSGMLYFSDGGNGGSNGTGGLIKYNLITQSVVYRQSYNFGVDSMAITPDGKTIFMPDGSAAYDGTWHIINTATGQVTGTIFTASGVAPHDTDMSASGQYVYMEGVDSNVLWVASTATGQIVQKVQPFAHDIRPFVVNQSGTLAYVTENGLIGFGVGNLQTGQMLYTVSAPGFNLPPGFDSQYVTPSHGISLSPDGKTVYVIDMPNSYVHVFNVSGVPGSAPTMTASIPISPISGTESPCTIDCTKEGWLEQSLDGRYLFVGNSGSIIDTTTNKVVTYLATLSDTRMFLEIDWVNGVPVNSEDRTDFYWNSGSIAPPTATATPTPAKTPTPGKTPTPTPTKKGMPTPTATSKSLGTGSQSATPASSSTSTQQSVAQTAAGTQGIGKQAPALIAGAIFILLATTLVVFLRRRKARKGSAQPAVPLNSAPPEGVAPPIQLSSNWTQPASYGNVLDQPTSPTLPVVNGSANGSPNMGLSSVAPLFRTGQMPTAPSSGGELANSLPPTTAPARHTLRSYGYLSPSVRKEATGGWDEKLSQGSEEGK